MSVARGPLLIGVDVGGTHTDTCVAAGDRLVRAKALTTHDDYSLGLLDALAVAAQRLDRSLEDLLGGADALVNGTTVVTNALTELRGARVGVHHHARVPGHAALRRRCPAPGLRRPAAAQPARRRAARLHPRGRRADHPRRHGARRPGRAAGARCGHQLARARRRVVGDLLSVVVSQPRARDPGARAGARGVAGGVHHALERDPPGDSRARALLQRGVQLVLPAQCQAPAADGLRAPRRPRVQRSFDVLLGSRGCDPGCPRRALSAAAACIRTGGRSLRCDRSGRADGPGRGARGRHGRYEL